MSETVTIYEVAFVKFKIHGHLLLVVVVQQAHISRQICLIKDAVQAFRTGCVTFAALLFQSLLHAQICQRVMNVRRFLTPCDLLIWMFFFTWFVVNACESLQAPFLFHLEEHVSYTGNHIVGFLFGVLCWERLWKLVSHGLVQPYHSQRASQPSTIKHFVFRALHFLCCFFLFWTFIQFFLEICTKKKDS